MARRSLFCMCFTRYENRYLTNSRYSYSSIKKSNGGTAMTRAKQFIQNRKRDDSNANFGWNDNGEGETWYSPWLNPDDALRAVEIEREDMIDKVSKWIETNFTTNDSRKSFISVGEKQPTNFNYAGNAENVGELINDFKKAMN